MRIDGLTEVVVLKRLAYTTLFLVVFAVVFSIALFEITSIIFVVLSLWAFLKEKDRWRELRGVFPALILLYVLMHVVSLFPSQYWEASLRGIVKVARNGLLCLSAVIVIDSEKKFSRVFQCFLMAAFLVSLDALIQGVIGRDLAAGRVMTAYSGDIKRLTGPFRHANDFSAYLSFACLLFLGVLTEGWKVFSRQKMVFFLAGFAMAFVCLLRTYSRGAWIAVGLASVVLVLYKKSRVLITVLSVAVIAGLLFSPPLLKARAVSLFDRHGTLHERWELWGESFRMIQASPWVGLGSNTYARNEPFYKREGSTTDNQYAHNGYLQMAAEIGLLGLSSFLAVLFYFFKGMRPIFRSPRAPLRVGALSFAFGIFSFLLHSATDTNLQSLLLVNLLWLSMGVAWAGRNLAGK